MTLLLTMRLQSSRFTAVHWEFHPSNVGDALDIARGIDPSPISEADNFAEHQVGDVTTYQSALVAT